MKYIIIQHTNPKKQALDVSRELFNISQPEKNADDVTEFLFSHIEHPTTGEIALVVEEEFNLNVHPNADAHIDNLSQMLTHRAQQAERDQLKAYMKSRSKVKFKDIIPSTIQMKTKGEMEADGWFDVEEL